MTVAYVKLLCPWELELKPAVVDFRLVGRPYSGYVLEALRIVLPGELH